MCDAIEELINDVKNSKVDTTIKTKLSNEDVRGVWDIVSSFVEKQMSMQKGVVIPGLGTFSFNQKKLDIGNNKFLLIQRPVFVVAEKFAQQHNLTHSKHYVKGDIPIVNLNYSALSLESPFTRDIIEQCVRELILAISRSIANQKNVELEFTGIGRLYIRHARVKMRFFKSFITSMDGSGKVIDAMRNRPGTLDSVMSQCELLRPVSTNTVLLPRLRSRADNAAGDAAEGGLTAPKMDIIDEDEEANPENEAQLPADAEEHPVIPKIGSRPSFAVAQAGMVSFADEDFVIPPDTSLRKYSPLTRSAPAHPFRKPPSPPLDERRREVPREPMDSRCGHRNAGQELCYLCHQRSQRNIPVYLNEERKRRDEEEDVLLSKYQQMKSVEADMQDQSKAIARRHDTQRVAAFNLGMAEAVKGKSRERPVDDQGRAYIFQKRPLTAPKFVKQTALAHELDKQIERKETDKKKERDDHDFLGRIERQQMEDDYLRDRERRRQEKLAHINSYKSHLDTQIRNKPEMLPVAEPDSAELIFGKNDMTFEKLEEKRRRAHEYADRQLSAVAQKKREAVLKQIQQQKEEGELIERDKKDLRETRATRFMRMMENRRRLEQEWMKAAEEKHLRDAEQKKQPSSPGIPLLEQTDQYKRCTQCQRKQVNCGETNIWCESRYPTGTRVIV